MKTRRRSKVEIREVARYLQQLRDEGIDTDESIAFLEDEQGPCPLDISHGLDYGGVFKSGLNTIFALPVSLVAQTRIILVDCRFETEWDKETISLPHLTLRCDFYFVDHVKFPRAKVLNTYLEQARALQRGAVFAGVILAYGFCGVPSEIRSGTDIPVRLTMIDSLGRSASAMISLPYERATTRKQNFVMVPGAVIESPVSSPQRDCERS